MNRTTAVCHTAYRGGTIAHPQHYDSIVAIRCYKRSLTKCIAGWHPSHKQHRGCCHKASPGNPIQTDRDYNRPGVGACVYVCSFLSSTQHKTWTRRPTMASVQPSICLARSSSAASIATTLPLTRFPALYTYHLVMYNQLIPVQKNDFYHFFSHQIFISRFFTLKTKLIVNELTVNVAWLHFMSVRTSIFISQHANCMLLLSQTCNYIFSHNLGIVTMP